jgi:hypothetical protein
VLKLWGFGKAVYTLLTAELSGPRFKVRLISFRVDFIDIRKKQVKIKV